MPDAPAKPLEKLFTRMQQAEEFGKEFDEAKERSVLGLPAPDGRAPVFLAASRERARMTETEDLRAREEMEAAAKVAQAGDAAERAAVLEAENARLRAQVDELRGGRAPRHGQPEPPVPGRALPDGVPTEEWTARQIIDWYKVRVVEPALPKGGAGMTKAALLEACAQALAEPGDSASEGETQDEPE